MEEIRQIFYFWQGHIEIKHAWAKTNNRQYIIVILLPTNKLTESDPQKQAISVEPPLPVTIEK